MVSEKSLSITLFVILFSAIAYAQTFTEGTYTAPARFGVNRFQMNPQVQCLVNAQIDDVWQEMRNFSKSVRIMSAAGSSDAHVVEGCSDQQSGSVIVNVLYPSGYQVYLRNIETSDFQFSRKFAIRTGSYPGTTTFYGEIKLQRVYLPSADSSQPPLDITLFMISQDFVSTDGASASSTFSAITGTTSNECRNVQNYFGVYPPTAPPTCAPTPTCPTCAPTPCSYPATGCSATVSVSLQGGNSYSVSVTNTGTRAIYAVGISITFASTPSVQSSYGLIQRCASTNPLNYDVNLYGGQIAAGSSYNNAGFTFNSPVTITSSSVISVTCTA